MKRNAELKNKRIAIIALMLLLCTGIFPSFASSDGITTIRAPENFGFREAIMTSNGHIILAGVTGHGMAYFPSTIAIDNSGQVLWAIDEPTEAQSLFYDLIELDGNRLLALRWNEDMTATAELIIDGQTVAEISGLGPAYVLFNAYDSDHFVLCCSANFETSWLEKRNMNGDVMWRADLPAGVTIHDVLPRKGGYIALGAKAENHEDAAQGITVEIDDAGQVVKQHITSDLSVFVQGINAEDDAFVVIGNKPEEHVDGDITSIYTHSFIAKYDGSGEVWRDDFYYETEEGRKDVRAKAFIRVDDGYLVAANFTRSGGAVMMLLYDSFGKRMSSWEESTMPVFNPLDIALLSQGNTPVLLASGFVTPGDLRTTEIGMKSIEINKRTRMIKVD